MINVLFLNATLAVGGAENALAELAMRLNRQRFRSIVCCLYGLGPIGERLRSQGLTVYERLMRHKLDVFGALRLVRLIRQEHVDILYLNNQPLTQFWGVLAARLAGVPIVVSVLHYTHRHYHGRRSRWVNRFMQRWTDQFIALSQMQKLYIARYEGLSADRIAVIPNGVDMQRFQQLSVNSVEKRQELGLPTQEPIVGIVAQLRPEKNHQLFLQAAQYLLRTQPAVHFLIVGDGSERAHLEAYTKDLELSGKVHFLGLRSDIPELMNLCDVGVLCSKSKSVETFPLAVLEFMAAGKPVVATDVGSISEIIVQGETGVLVPEGDAQTLANAILDLLQRPEPARCMGNAGRERVRQYYTVEHTVMRTADLLEELLKQKLHRTRQPKTTSILNDRRGL